ncbi:MAG: phosphate ABC transporter substrate-binding protein PstS family protein [Acidobacteria bacterium]|nr:MAG: phosphate ABC transporter substrate-binding protein PstS family protein [Acidobacteriota bacterium]REJ99524.1 MAG: phosphate ABC transporter substrate-binding protein PstS family protein [Acidobacteriota bacterium]
MIVSTPLSTLPKCRLRRRSRLHLALASASVLVVAAACGGESADNAGAGGDSLEGTVSVDGSSTVFPITEAVAEEFRGVAPDVRVTVGISGTGGGFKKFGAGEIDINDASRPIKETELEQAAGNGIQFVEIPIAFDGLSVVVHPENDWVDHLTVDELRAIWNPESTLSTWAEVRAGWPDEEIALFAPGTDSGTFDYFTEAINGQGGASRADFTASEDDNVIVQGVSGDRHALGFFGFAYYIENASAVKVVPIDGGAGPVTPTPETINDGSYAPLSRPVFLYLNTASLDRPEVAAFVDFYLDNAAELSEEVGYVQLPAEAYEVARQRVEQRVTGTVYGEGQTHGVPLVELFAVE